MEVIYSSDDNEECPKLVPNDVKAPKEETVDIKKNDGASVAEMLKKRIAEKTKAGKLKAIDGDSNVKNQKVKEESKK